LTIVAGPESRDGLIWWRVRGAVAGETVEAWAAQELDTGQMLLEKVQPKTAPPPRYQPGDRAMTVNFVRLRRTPGFMNKPAEDVIAEIWQGTEVVFVAGP